MINKFTVSEDYEGVRLDKYLSEMLPLLSRSNIAHIIDDENVSVDDKICAKKEKLKVGQTVCIEIPEAKPTDIKPEEIPLDVVYEDSDLLVVNKPKGMVVHPAAGHYEGTLVNALMYHCGDSLSGINGEIRPGILHRIDKDTSGLLIVAKNDFAHVNLASQIKAHSFRREYEAVSEGVFKNTSGTINAPIGRNKNNRLKMAVTETNSKDAITHYEVIKQYNKYAHLKLKLETGRTHQIRVHLSYCGHPIAGDEVYGARKHSGLCGQCLHAKLIGFNHPRTNEYIEFSSELPKYFKEFLEKAEQE